MLYSSVKEWKRKTEPWMYPTMPDHMLLYVVGATAAVRDEAAASVRKILKNFLKEAAIERAIRSYHITDIDVQETPDICQNPQHPMWWSLRVPESQKHIYIPIFHNADAATNLGQTLFDMNARGVICVTRHGYESTTNPSKRECIDAIMLE